MKIRKTKDDEWIRTNVRISKFVFNKAIDYNVSLSQFLEMKLREYFYMIEQTSITPSIQPRINSCTQDTQQSKKNKGGKTSNSYEEMGLLRFERKSMAPEATRIPSYPTGPNLQEYCHWNY